MMNIKNETKSILRDARRLGISRAECSADDGSVLPLLAAIRDGSPEKSVVHYIFRHAVDRDYTDEQMTVALSIIDDMNAYIRDAVSKSTNSKRDIDRTMIEIIKNGESLGVLDCSSVETTTPADDDAVASDESESLSENVQRFFDDDSIGTEAEWVNKNPDFEYIYGGCYLNKKTRMIEYLYHRRHDRLLHIGFVEHDGKNYEVYVDNRYIGTIAKNWSSFRPNGDSDSNFFLTGIQRSMEKIAVADMESEKRAAVGDPWFD